MIGHTVWLDCRVNGERIGSEWGVKWGSSCESNLPTDTTGAVYIYIGKEFGQELRMVTKGQEDSQQGTRQVRLSVSHLITREARRLRMQNRATLSEWAQDQQPEARCYSRSDLPTYPSLPRTPDIGQDRFLHQMLQTTTRIGIAGLRKGVTGVSGAGAENELCPRRLAVCVGLRG